ncbi:Catalase-related peroxidase [Mycobacterium marinum]|uniref:catalase family peroxidase n=1 Tax=Mycobacterium marinum TaxID=1781 RepID=UPI000E3CFA4A|nr:catalase family peroxidase [Mycobacterium marinum]MDC9003773.1 catalase family peroxidase [Mycobacterium marinum]QQW35250.1 catalase family peroxidase [Mycobacterium marinum]RFZ54073.1 Catalase-related peroxidase [Mycobacterium marinum]
MGGSVTPDEAIEAIRGTGGACPGYRALHAKGTLYRGTFTATPEAAGLSRAKHFDGAPVAALIRFSNGSGKPTQRDGAPGVRGMAVKFTLPDKSTTDVSMQTARLFTSSTPEGFVDLLKALRPSLTTPARIAKYLATHPRMLAALPILGAANRIPASYATCEYHGLHAFRWVAADGSARFVRYHMIPAVGEKFLSPLAARNQGADFLTDELQTRLAAGPVRFYFRVQIAGPGDSIVDPSVPWQGSDMVTVGTLDVTGVDTEREHDGDIVVFDPMRVTDGIEASDDPVLRFRTLAYSASVKLRTGVDRGPQAPPDPA